MDQAPATSVATQALATGKDNLSGVVSTGCFESGCWQGANEARALYLKYRGQEVENGSPWEKGVLDDFRALQEAGITNPLMTEIEKAFAKPP